MRFVITLGIFKSPFLEDVQRHATVVCPCPFSAAACIFTLFLAWRASLGHCEVEMRNHGSRREELYGFIVGKEEGQGLEKGRLAPPFPSQERSACLSPS